MFGSLMMLASGDFASSPSSARASASRWSSGRRSEKAATMRPAREMSRVVTSIPAVSEKASRIGRNDAVASIGASSVWV